MAWHWKPAIEGSTEQQLIREESVSWCVRSAIDRDGYRGEIQISFAKFFN